MLARHPDHIDNTVLAQFPEFQELLSQAKTTASPPGEGRGGLAEPQATPEEAIDAAQREMRAALAEEVLGRVLNKPAEFFETVVLDVLLAMGYGGSREDAAQRLGRTGDQGLDGVICRVPVGGCWQAVVESSVIPLVIPPGGTPSDRSASAGRRTLPELQEQHPTRHRRRLRTDS